MQAVYMISAAALFVPALYHMTTEETRGPQNPNAPGMCPPPLSHNTLSARVQEYLWSTTQWRTVLGKGQFT